MPNFLTCNAVFILPLLLQRLDIDTAVTDESSTGNATIWLAKMFFTWPKEKKQNKKKNQV